MFSLSKFLNVVLFGLSASLLALATERRAYAYVDPGSSLVMLQGVGAALSAALFYFRKRVTRLFRRTTRNKIERASSDV